MKKGIIAMDLVIALTVGLILVDIIIPWAAKATVKDEPYQPIRVMECKIN